jgi:hypothetical protein
LLVAGKISSPRHEGHQASTEEGRQPKKNQESQVNAKEFGFSRCLGVLVMQGS